MTASPPAPRAVLAGVLVTVALAGCANTPRVAPTAAAPTPSPRAPAMVTMAPIANPEAPGRARRDTTRTRRSEPSSQPTHHAAPKAPPPTTTAPPAPPPAAAPAHDPVRAAQLRAHGLEQLNRGSAAQAVALLAQANRLDPDNVLIRRDLERAERIDRAVGGKH